MEKIKPGIYRSKTDGLPCRLYVHFVSETHVHFTRAGLPGISIRTIESFRGIIVIEEPAPLKHKKGLGAG